MRKAINFDIDTKKYEEFTGKKAPTAYEQIRRFLKKYDFEHRQGSGYISKGNVTNADIATLVKNMALKFEWLNYSIKEIDVTNIGKQHSLVDTINRAKAENNLINLDNLEI